MFHAMLEPSPIDVGALFSAVGKVIERNRQQNTDTDGFLLGAQFRAWTNMALLADTEVDPKLVDKAHAREYGRLYFAGYRKLQQQLGIDDATLCKLVGLSQEAVKPLIDKWSKLK